MDDMLTTPLPASWLSSRLGVSAREIDSLRERGELFAVRSGDGREWLYPAWQFGPGGKVPAGVRAAVKTARAVGLDEPDGAPQPRPEPSAARTASST